MIELCANVTLRRRRRDVRCVQKQISKMQVHFLVADTHPPLVHRQECIFGMPLLPAPMAYYIRLCMMCRMYARSIPHRWCRAVYFCTLENASTLWDMNCVCHPTRAVGYSFQLKIRGIWGASCACALGRLRNEARRPEYTHTERVLSALLIIWALCGGNWARLPEWWCMRCRARCEWWAQMLVATMDIFYYRKMYMV